MKRKTVFSKIAKKTARATGHSTTFVAALALIAIWALTGPIFGFSDTWQLVINTATTIVTFLMVFLLQNTQNRDSEALQLKLDELLRAIRHANTAFVDIEELADEDLERIKARFAELAKKARARLRDEDWASYFKDVEER